MAEKSDDATGKATPRAELLEVLMSSMVAKSELEWFARGEIIQLREQLAAAEGVVERVLDNMEDYDCGCCIRIADGPTVDMLDQLRKARKAAAKAKEQKDA